MANVKVFEVRSELGAGTRGASLGIDAMRMASLVKGSRFFYENKVHTIEDENHFLFADTDTPKAKRISGIVKMFDKISATIRNEVIAGTSFPVILAADHSSAGGTIAGLKAAFPEKRLGVVWIDAHADLHSPYTTPSGNVHGMPLATALAEDNLDKAINELDDKTSRFWNELKEMGGVSPKIKSEDIVFFGVRDTEDPEDYLIEKGNIRNITVSELRSVGVSEAVQKALEHLSQCDVIYISFDVDSMDSDISKGTGTPVPDGFTVGEAEEIISLLLKDPRINCFEIVEVNPILDNKCNKMAEVAFHILESTCAQIANRFQNA